MILLQIPLTHFLYLAAFLFCIGIFLVLSKKHLILILIGIELMLNAANINLVAFSYHNKELEGQMFSLFVLVVAVCESAVALAIVLRAFRYYNTTDPDKINNLKG